MSIRHFLRRTMLPIDFIERKLPESGLVYEIGSGNGTLAIALARSSPNLEFIGIDRNTEKIRQTNQGALPQNVELIEADALHYSYKTCDGVIMSDFLHHISYTQQQQLLKTLAKKLKKNGVLIIKEIDKGDGLLMFMSRFWDWLFYPQDEIFYRHKHELAGLLTDMGFSVTMTRQVPWFPGSTHVFICRKN